MRIKMYWDLGFAAEKYSGKHPERWSDRDAVAQWTETFREAVRSHLMADVPLGLFLSGGIDSSAIAAVMSRMVSEPMLKWW